MPSALRSLYVLQLKVLRKSMLSPKGDEQSVLHSHSNLTWASIDGRCLQSRTGALPANWVCGLHALWAIKVHSVIASKFDLDNLA